ncbi:MAG: DUF1934 domain-containing protein [Lachnospiraceae bacterium]|nr:DUF1934 domain-containing protein [Lachnospiraceae bacterium]
MKKNVLIKITGLRAGGSEDEDMELMVNGTFMQSEDKVYLSYEETDPDGMDYKCRLKLGKDEVVYSKTGILTTELYYCLGEPYESIVNTPFGTLEVEIVTEKIEYKNNPEALVDLSLDYLLTLNDEYVSNCNMKVYVQEIVNPAIL